MKQKRFTEEQIIGILKEAEAGEMPAVAVCRKHGVSEQTFYRWKSKFGGMEISEAKRLKAMEEENRRLNEHWFTSLTEARRIIETWRRHYNEERPHSALDYETPANFARRSAGLRGEGHSAPP